MHANLYAISIGHNINILEAIISFFLDIQDILVQWFFELEIKFRKNIPKSDETDFLLDQLVKIEISF